MDVVKAPDNSREQRLTHLVEAYQKPLLDLCYIYLHDRALAEDAVQETFLKAYRGMKAFRGGSKERTWLTRIAINTCRDIKRSAWHRHTNRAVTPEELPAAEERPHSLHIDIADAVMHLPDPYKKVVKLPNSNGVRYVTLSSDKKTAYVYLSGYKEEGYMYVYPLEDGTGAGLKLVMATSNGYGFLQKNGTDLLDMFVDGQMDSLTLTRRLDERMRMMKLEGLE